MEKRHENAAQTLQASRSKLLMTKRAAHKEIEMWAQGAGMLQNGAELARGSQLNNNVTEEKLLRGQLLKLSKERFKIIAEKDFQKNRFIDRQQTKAKKLTRLLINIDLELYRKKDVSENDMLRNRLLYNRKLVVANRFNLNIKDFDKNEETTNTEVNINAPLLQQSPRRPHTVSEAMLRNYQPQQLPNINMKETVRQQPEEAKISDVEQSSVIQPEVTIRPMTCALERQLTRIPNTFSRQSSARRKVLQDPRCYNLCHVLEPVYKSSKSENDVPTLVSHINALHLPSKRTVQLKLKPSPEALMRMFEDRCRVLYKDSKPSHLLLSRPTSRLFD